MPTTARRLIDAFLTGDAPSAAALLAPDATFHSPIRDYAGAIKGQSVDGVLRTLTDDENRVADITLMVRPWAALKAGIADINI